MEHKITKEEYLKAKEVCRLYRKQCKRRRLIVVFDTKTSEESEYKTIKEASDKLCIRYHSIRMGMARGQALIYNRFKFNWKDK